MSVVVEPIEKGGSGRKFWRVNVSGQSHILVRYGEERPENRYYVEIGQFLASVGVRIPKVYYHDPAEGLILMEDAGGGDLWSHRADPWPQRRALYQRTLDEVLMLHTRAHLVEPRPHLQQSFDEALYRWEQNYFIENCLQRHFGIAEPDIERDRLAEIAVQLAAEPRCLVHRDFQSQNVIIRDGQACFIDFQGLRPGLAQYDIASLLLDPYVALTPAERNELLGHYLSGLMGAERSEEAEWMRLYDLCAMQRLMQALGAYGKLGHLDGRTEFLEHVPVALTRLREVVARVGGLDRLGRLLGQVG